MNKIEVGQLLIIASGFDRFITPERVPVESWHLLLADVDYESARMVVVEFYRTWDGHGQLTVSHILESTKIVNRQHPSQIAADVRAARARRLIDADWDERTPLPLAVAMKLRKLREIDRDTAWMRPVPWTGPSRA